MIRMVSSLTGIRQEEEHKCRTLVKGAVCGVFTTARGLLRSVAGRALRTLSSALVRSFRAFGACVFLVWLLLGSHWLMKENFFTSPFGYRVQKTIQSELRFHGIGLHTGVKSAIRLLPAPPNHGILF